MRDHMLAMRSLSPDDLGILLTWFEVLSICTAMLVGEALSLGLLSIVRSPRGLLLRVGALVTLLAAVGAGLLAWGAQSTYSELLPANLPRSYPIEFRDAYLQRINQAIGFYSAAGCIVVVATGVLLIAAGALAVKAIRGRGPTNHEGTGPFRMGRLFTRPGRTVG